MQQNIVRPNIKKSACLLVSCCTASAKTVQIRGAPGSVKTGSTMLPDGFNFPDLIYQLKDNQTYEWLNISFSANGTIDKGGASYKTKLYATNTIMFMGSKYYSLDPGKAGILSKKFPSGWSNGKKTFSIGEVCEFSQNYTLTVVDIDSNSENAMLQLAKNGEVVEYDVVASGGTFEYKTDIANANDVTIFKCKVDAILRGTDSNIVLLKSVKHYSDTPLILNTGDKFGDFEIISITNDTIEMNNSKTISCSLDKSVDLLDDWLDLKVSEKGYWGYVYTTKTLECAEPVKVSSTAGSADASSTAQNTTASNTSDNTGTNSTIAVLPATPAPGTTSAVTAETEQPAMLAAAEGAGIAPHALPAPGAASLVSLFAILVLMMNIRKNKK